MLGRFSMMIAAVLLVGCASSPPAKSDDATLGAAEPTPPPPPASTLRSVDPAPRSDRPDPRAPALGDADDYDVTPSDCRDLAGNYGRLWEAKELKTQDASKMNDAQRKNWEATIHKAGVEARDNWAESCRGIVGTTYSYKQLQCSLDAKSVERFDACWEGRAE